MKYTVRYVPTVSELGRVETIGFRTNIENELTNLSKEGCEIFAITPIVTNGQTQGVLITAKYSD